MADERPQIAGARTSYTYRANTQPVPSNAAVHVLNRAYSVTADVDVPKGGADSGAPVWDKYKPPFKFSGKLYGVTIAVTGDLIVDTEQAMKMAMARQ